MPTKYELERSRRIEQNKALLAKLGVEQYKPPKSAAAVAAANKATAGANGKPKAAAGRKRKAQVKPEDDYSDASGDEEEEDEDDDDDDVDDGKVRKPKRKKQKPAVDVPAGVRRSSRNAGRTVDYNKERRGGQPKPVVPIERYAGDAEEGGRGGRKADRSALGKRYGSVPGVEVGSWWKMRMDCRLAGIHLPLVAGISGCADGAYSVALSGGYEDDVDLGDGFVFTGSGGRDLKGTKDKPKNLRTAPQSSDQSFENHFNRALKKSVETRKPVRVVRGYKLGSPYAPVEGYRYDGLYTVEKAWMEKGMNKEGYLVCKFAFKVHADNMPSAHSLADMVLQRLPGQPPLPYRDRDAEKAEAEPTEEKDENATDEEESANEEDASDDA
ncbi:hypothetical protein EVG20_g6731 [Dentipellis fragilis]|uniref:YDG domain-containing protein n=1 Tax=Dentipellis fragilis TaxID=205917 RepID=A0A4Y9YKW0_9AGAM|nr:hypothetical protein EVG20_g6731 [Dentipellis fragilis]